MPLAVALLPEQIEAANRLHDRSVYWQTTDQVLNALTEKFPDFEAEATLLKVVTVNALYSTQLYAVQRMADHAQSLIGNTNLENAGPQFVERLGELPATEPGGQPRRHYSFASKFAHFFIDRERFPLMDSYAKEMLLFHLGTSEIIEDPNHEYEAFVHNFCNLKQLARIQGTNRRLDRYLWLAGLYRKWEEDPESGINVEAKRLFSEAKDQTPELLTDLVPAN